MHLSACYLPVLLPNSKSWLTGAFTCSAVTCYRVTAYVLYFRYCVLIVSRFTYRSCVIFYIADRFLDLFPSLSEFSRILLKINSQTLDNTDGIKNVFDSVRVVFSDSLHPLGSCIFKMPRWVSCVLQMLPLHRTDQAVRGRQIAISVVFYFHVVLSTASCNLTHRIWSWLPSHWLLFSFLWRSLDEFRFWCESG